MTRYIIDYLLLRAYSLTIPLDVTNNQQIVAPKYIFSFDPKVIPEKKNKQEKIKYP